ncbi:hypothetical protein [Streptomyces achromogenes]|uniref:hypothetical protein n=1 Tax=Streptomyces achromogenes TaxID=67255 RepID=UPI0004CA1025|nr:hypothetical protein [Streptomyces achromogenes]
MQVAECEPRRGDSGTLGVSAIVAPGLAPRAAQVDATGTLRLAPHSRVANTTETRVFEMATGSLSRRSSHITVEGDHVDFGQDTSTDDSP